MSVFNVGDVVVLNSGGPKMTIIESLNKGAVFKTCWFVEGVLQSGEFLGETLRLFEDEDIYLNDKNQR